MIDPTYHKTPYFRQVTSTITERAYLPLCIYSYTGQRDVHSITTPVVHRQLDAMYFTTNHMNLLIMLMVLGSCIIFFPNSNQTSQGDIRVHRLQLLFSAAICSKPIMYKVCSPLEQFHCASVKGFDVFLENICIHEVF